MALHGIPAAVLVPSLFWAPAHQEPQPLQFHEKILGNGLRVVTLEDHSCPVVAVQVWYHVGSKDENPERQGFAHMFEHMMFRGTDRVKPEEYSALLRSIGGSCNAYTAFDQTVYVNFVPAHQLPLALWLEADRMASLRVDEEGFATERKVVEEERRQLLNQPYGSVPEKALARLYRTHPYRWTPIGQIPHLRASKAEELLRFWERFYVPNNATLVVVGDVEHKKAEEAAEEAFGWIPRCPEPPRVEAKEPFPKEPPRLEIEEEKGPVPVVGVLYRTVPDSHADSIPLSLLFQILGGGKSSRLYRVLVDELEIAEYAGGGFFALEMEGFAVAAGITLPGGNTERILASLEEELEKIRKEGVSDKELSKAKAQALRALVDRSTKVESKAQILGSSVLFHGGPQYMNEQAGLIRKVTAGDLKRVAEIYLVPERKAVLNVKPTVAGIVGSLLGGGGSGPHEDEGAAPARAAEASARPAPRGPKAEARRPEGFPERPPLQPLKLPKVDMSAKTKTLKNGLRVVVVENHEAPLVTAELRLKTGAFLDREIGKGGCGSLTLSMLDRGTSKHTAQELAEELESHAIRLSAEASMDSSSVEASALKPQAGRMMRLLAEVVREPIFTKKEFAKLKRQALTGLLIQEKNPKHIAEREFQKGLFGDHFYAGDAQGTSEGVKKIEAADCASWWRRAALPKEASLYFSGDLAAEDAFAVAEAFFEDWNPEGALPTPPKAEIPAPEKTRILLVDQPGAYQSEIRVGHLGITRHDPRYSASRVLNQVFGGAYESRLNKRIRIEKGLTYGARGGLYAGRFAGRFEISTFTKTPKTAETLRVVLDEIENLRKTPPTAEELGQARSFLLGSFAGNHETPESIAGELWNLELEGLPKDFLDRHLERVAQTSSEAVAKIAGEIVRPERLFIVVVGDARRIRKDLEPFGPVTLVDEAGKPKKLEEAAAEDEEEE